MRTEQWCGISMTFTFDNDHAFLDIGDFAK